MVYTFDNLKSREKHEQAEDEVGHTGSNIKAHIRPRLHWSLIGWLILRLTILWLTILRLTILRLTILRGLILWRLTRLRRLLVGWLLWGHLRIAHGDVFGVHRD